MEFKLLKHKKVSEGEGGAFLGFGFISGDGAACGFVRFAFSTFFLSLLCRSGTNIRIQQTPWTWVTSSWSRSFAWVAWRRGGRLERLRLADKMREVYRKIRVCFLVRDVFVEFASLNSNRARRKRNKNEEHDTWATNAEFNDGSMNSHTKQTWKKSENA